jgi:magnesium transporter
MAKKGKKIGLPPGTVVFTGKRKVDKINIHYLEYNASESNDVVLDNQSITSFHKPTPTFIQWYDTRGVHDTALIKAIGNTFSMHPLALEDIASTFQRPKMDEFENGLFVTFRAFSFHKEESKVISEQVALYLGNGYVLSFQEDATDLFSSIRSRITTGAGRIRLKGADYLFYTLIDSIIDQYYLVIDDLEEILENFEKDVIKNISNETRGDIYELKQEVNVMRKSLFPTRELVNRLISSEHQIIHENTIPYLRDLRDHLSQVIEQLDYQLENLNSLQELFISQVGYRSNKVMQVLTIVATIFIPLTFLAGIYGMNFQHMPELGWKYGYFILLLIMLIIVICLLFFFRKKKWL